MEEKAENLLFEKIEYSENTVVRLKSTPPSKPLKVKRALVLSGGGAKGAYAFGCLKAFKERNIEFDAVSGTSVGALNALLWSTNSMNEGQKLWDELSFSTVYPVRLFSKQGNPSVLFRLFAPLVFTYNLLSSSWQGEPNPVSRILAPFLFLLWVLPFVPAILLISYIQVVEFRDIGLPSINSAWDLLPQFIILYCIYIFVIELRKTYNQIAQNKVDSSKHFSGLIVAFLIFIGILILFLVFMRFRGGAFPEQFVNIIILFLAPILILPILMAFIVKIFLFCISRINKKIGSVLDSTPLYKTIDKIVKYKSFNIPTFVTTAVLKEMYDPDFNDWCPDNESIPSIWKFIIRPKFFELASKKFWLPKYSEVSRLPTEDSSLFCLASAALPFGIVPSVEIQKEEFVDGGIIDNTPFFPFIEEIQAEEIYVISLENFKSDDEAIEKLEITLKKWQELERLQRIQYYPKPEQLLNKDKEKILRFKEQLIPYREIKNFPIIKPFYPRSESLGNFLTGTLNFSGQYASKIMQRGYLETLKILDENEKLSFN